MFVFGLFIATDCVHANVLQTNRVGFYVAQF